MGSIKTFHFELKILNDSQTVFTLNGAFTSFLALFRGIAAGGVTDLFVTYPWGLSEDIQTSLWSAIEGVLLNGRKSARP